MHILSLGEIAPDILCVADESGISAHAVIGKRIIRLDSNYINISIITALCGIRVKLCGRRISAIAPKAFFGNRTLEQAGIGAGVRVIGESAFMGCTALELCTFERGLEEIGPSAFAGCERLVQAVLPWGMKWVRRMAFFGCTRLGFVKMPNDTLVEGLAFEGCGPALRVFGGRQEERI